MSLNNDKLVERMGGLGGRGGGWCGGRGKVWGEGGEGIVSL